MTFKTIAKTAIVTGALVWGAMTVHADDCTTNYGGTTTCVPTDLFINKMVQNPKTGEYVDNVITPIFNQGNTVVFKMVVTNSSNQTLTDVKVTDQVPENFEITDAQVNFTIRESRLVNGRAYAINSDRRFITFYLDEMAPGQVKEMFLWTKLIGPYPAGDSFCRDNWANVTAVERPNGDKNFARACVTNQVLGTTTLPVSGAEDLLMMLPFVGTGLGGLALLRKSKKQ